LKKLKKTPWFSYIVIILGSIAMVFPFLDMVMGSFKGVAEYSKLYYTFLPEKFTFDNYQKAFAQLKMGMLFKNSIIRSVITTVIILLTSSLAGYALTKLRFKGRDAIFKFILATMMFPNFLFLIPNFYIMVHWPLVGGNDLLGRDGYGGMASSVWSLILPFAVSAFGIFLMRQFIMNIHDAYIEAARIDGASELRIFFTLVLPMTVPALATLAIFEFINSWNEFIWALLMNTVNKDLATLPVGIQTLKSHLDASLTKPLVLSGLVISVLPLLIIFIFLQKYYIKGAMNTGVKE